MSTLNFSVTAVNNGCAPIYQSPAVTNHGLPFGNVGTIEGGFQATGQVQGIAATDSLRLLLFAATQDETAWTIGTAWVTTPASDGSWSLSIPQSAPEFACAVMTETAYSTYMSDNFPSGDSMTVATLPSADQSPGNVLYSSPLPASWGRSLVGGGRTVPAGTSLDNSGFGGVGYSTASNQYEVWQVHSDPTASQDATNQWWNQSGFRMPCIRFQGALPDGTVLGGLLILGLYNYDGGIYFYAASGPSRIQASQQFPASLRSKKLGALNPCTDNVEAQLELSVFEDSISIKILQIQVTESLAQQLLEVLIKLEKIFIKSLFGLIDL